MLISGVALAIIATLSILAAQSVIAQSFQVLRGDFVYAVCVFSGYNLVVGITLEILTRTIPKTPAVQRHISSPVEKEPSPPPKKPGIFFSEPELVSFLGEIAHLSIEEQIGKIEEKQHKVDPSHVHILQSRLDFLHKESEEIQNLLCDYETVDKMNEKKETTLEGCLALFAIVSQKEQSEAVRAAEQERYPDKDLGRLREEQWEYFFTQVGRLSFADRFILFDKQIELLPPPYQERAQRFSWPTLEDLTCPFSHYDIWYEEDLVTKIQLFETLPSVDVLESDNSPHVGEALRAYLKVAREGPELLCRQIALLPVDTRVAIARSWMSVLPECQFWIDEYPDESLLSTYRSKNSLNASDLAFLFAHFIRERNFDAAYALRTRLACHDAREWIINSRVDYYFALDYFFEEQFRHPLHSWLIEHGGTCEFRSPPNEFGPFSGIDDVAELVNHHLGDNELIGKLATRMLEQLVTEHLETAVDPENLKNDINFAFLATNRQLETLEYVMQSMPYDEFLSFRRENHQLLGEWRSLFPNRAPPFLAELISSYFGEMFKELQENFEQLEGKPGQVIASISRYLDLVEIWLPSHRAALLTKLDLQQEMEVRWRGKMRKIVLRDLLALFALSNASAPDRLNSNDFMKENKQVIKEIEKKGALYSEAEGRLSLESELSLYLREVATRLITRLTPEEGTSTSAETSETDEELISIKDCLQAIEENRPGGLEDLKGWARQGIFEDPFLNQLIVECFVHKNAEEGVLFTYLQETFGTPAGSSELPNPQDA